MVDELKVRLAEQGIGYEEYLRATERDERKVIAEFKPDAERRVKTLLVLSEIAEKEGVEVSDEELDAELVRSRERYADNPAWSSTSNRRVVGPTRARCCAAPRQSRRWSIAGSTQHPEFENVQHLHDDGHEGPRTSTRKEVTDARPDGHRNVEPG